MRTTQLDGVRVINRCLSEERKGGGGEMGVERDERREGTMGVLYPVPSGKMVAKFLAL